MRRSLLAAPAIAAGLAATVLVLPAFAETRTYNLAGFTEISASSSADVVLKQGPYSVTAESSKGDFKDLVVEVRGDTLVVKRESKGWNWNDRGVHYTVTVTAPSIDELQASSSADIVASGYRFANLGVAVSSSGNITLSGSCTDLDVEVSSSGDFRGADLRCENARVTASSSGDADVYASKSANGQASSSGDVRIHGKPATLDKSTSSSGSVKVL
jgi:Putative auto-transporter adhesin, head GIN domain